MMVSMCKRVAQISALSVAVSWGSSVLACGGCFHSPTEQSEVTGHRMVFAISDERTVLWDQFEYEGEPSEFAWVLPVAPGAYLELASQAWFDALEGMTVTQVQAPSFQCASADSGGCGSAERASFGSQAAAFDEPSVQVVRRQNVGPYETVILHSNDANALQAWLDENDYYVPQDIEPVIENYVAEGADFLALKLQPGLGVSRMEPVRVVTPGGDPILPLRMVAAGVFDDVDIVLHVIAEGRHTLPDLTQKEVDPNEVVWDFRSQTSNYADVRAEVLGDEDGRNVLTTYAQRAALTSGRSFSVSTDTQFAGGSFSEVYGQLADSSCQLDGTNGDELVVDPCYGDPNADLPVACEDATTGQQPSSDYACEELTDLAAALVGMVPSKTWVTRLEMTLPRYALDMDCEVEAVDDDEISNALIAGAHEGNFPCDLPLFSASVAKGKPRPPAMASLLGLALAGFVWRRRQAHHRAQ